MTLRKKMRRWYRGFKARFFPLRFAQWVNMERCFISICNDSSGMWHVKIGVKNPEQCGMTLDRAMLKAFAVNDFDPDWQWTSDYLEDLLRY